MIFRLLSNGKGVITSRQPKVVKEKSDFLFNGAPHGATAVFTVAGVTYYRELNKDGRCNIPCKNLEGAITVSITLADKSARIKRYVCEGLKAERIADGVLLLPDDSNLAEEFAKSRVEADELRGEMKKLRDEFSELKDTFNKMMEGYGLV